MSDDIGGGISSKWGRTKKNPNPTRIGRPPTPGGPLENLQKQYIPICGHGIRPNRNFKAEYNGYPRCPQSCQRRPFSAGVGVGSCPKTGSDHVLLAVFGRCTPGGPPRYSKLVGGSVTFCAGSSPLSIGANGNRIGAKLATPQPPARTHHQPKTRAENVENRPCLLHET